MCPSSTVTSGYSTISFPRKSRRAVMVLVIRFAAPQEGYSNRRGGSGAVSQWEYIEAKEVYVVFR
jgi:hypothetical protein